MAAGVPEASIDQVADEYIERNAGSKVAQFVLFAGRFTRERLRELVTAGTGSGNWN